LGIRYVVPEALAVGMVVPVLNVTREVELRFGVAPSIVKAIDAFVVADEMLKVGWGVVAERKV
jgi:ABC-type uncharacterized transport system permease subunit